MRSMVVPPSLVSLLSLSVALALPGCYQEPEVVVHKPGQYMGKEDPLLEVAGNPEHEELLAKRLRMVQTDR